MVSTPHDGSRPCLPPSMLRPTHDRVPSQPIAVHGRHRTGPGRPRHLRQPRSALGWSLGAVDSRLYVRAGARGVLMGLRRVAAGGAIRCRPLFGAAVHGPDHPVPALALSLACGAALAGAMR
jgi:hypothetical protein